MNDDVKFPYVFNVCLPLALQTHVVNAHSKHAADAFI